ncbi:hypothetical protein H2200_001567 [Cladophialophora chaetospira]|uniref:Uncharacterized protein n=1 Tax=Cladophialophora chaetospira TaxID=386627 RepID=A0AA38XL43_9EURO|nr:hypothetical protein H2200_001567 [Cladophialophora chaetospira]
MPSFIRLEKTQTTKEYERGWDYVEKRHGRLVMVRNKRDSRDVHHGGWKTTKPKERPVKEYVLVGKDHERVRLERPAPPRDGKVFIKIGTDEIVRRGSPDPDDVARPTSPLRIQVRRPIHSPPPPPHCEIREPREIRPHHYYVDEADARLVKKVPVEKVRLQRVRPMEIVEEDTYCEYGDDEIYEDMLHVFDTPIREARPYHIPEPENSYWDDDWQAWMVQRKPRVRFE